MGNDNNTCEHRAHVTLTLLVLFLSDQLLQLLPFVLHLSLPIVNFVLAGRQKERHVSEGAPPRKLDGVRIKLQQRLEIGTQMSDICTRLCAVTSNLLLSRAAAEAARWLLSLWLLASGQSAPPPPSPLSSTD